MSTELVMLAWAVVLGLAQVLINGMLTTGSFGVKYALSPRDEQKQLTGVPARLERAFANYMQTFPFFTAAVAVTNAVGQHNDWTVYGAELYFWARLAYVPLYAAGVPVARSVAFLLATLGIVALLIGVT